MEHPILAWLESPEPGWRFENQVSVNEHYRSDEEEVLLSHKTKLTIPAQLHRVLMNRPK